MLLQNNFSLSVPWGFLQYMHMQGFFLQLTSFLKKKIHNSQGIQRESNISYYYPIARNFKNHNKLAFHQVEVWLIFKIILTH